MGKIATKSYCNSIAPGAFSDKDLNRCPTKSEISSTDKFDNSKLGSYAANQLVKEVDIVIKLSGVLFTVTIDNRSSSVGANLNIAYRFSAAPGIYAFANKRQVGVTSRKGITTDTMGPFNTTVMYGNSNVLFWTGTVGFSYSYSAIVGTSGITYSSAGSGTYNGNNQGATVNNLEYITLFSQSINDGDSISLSVIIY